MIQVAESAEFRTSHGYDEVGNRRFQTDPNANTTEWEYDNLGRVTERTLPLGMSESFVHDPNGNVTEKTDFNDDKIVYAYDVNNRPVRKTYPDGSVVSFTYTPTGQRETVTDSRGTTAYAYDLRDRVKEVTNPDGTVISYAYDAAGNRTSVTVPSGTTTYTYDVLNRLKTVTDPDGGVTAYTYDKVGNRKSVTYPNGIVAEYMYDRLNRLIKLENRNASGDLISGYIYTLGPAGNREQTEELHSGRVVRYSYDELHRMTAEEITDPVLGNETISYAHDAFGNRLAKGSSGGTISYSYNDNDELEAESGLTYGYDDNGNTVSRNDGTDTVAYGYDYENRLVSAGSVGYVYDADGIRVSSADEGSVTEYLVDKNRQYAQVLEERNGGSSVSYVYGDDLISRKQGGEIRYYVYDGHGSVRHLTDADGAVTDSYIYDAFGNLRDHLGGSDNRYLYAGEQYDPDAGLYYLRARYYDPENGRFLTHDPYVGNPQEPVTFHKYLYGNANPVTYIDPSGKFSIAGAAQTMATLMLITQLYNNVSHNISNLKPVVWDGQLYVSQYSGGGKSWFRGYGPQIGVSFLVVHLSTDAYGGASGTYLIFTMGLTVDDGGSDWSLNKLRVETPGIFKANRELLQGPVNFGSLAFCARRRGAYSPPGSLGRGATYLNMGMGRVASIGFDWIWGNDNGFDLQWGISSRIRND